MALFYRPMYHRSRTEEGWTDTVGSDGSSHLSLWEEPSVHEEHDGPNYRHLNTATNDGKNPALGSGEDPKWFQQTRLPQPLLWTRQYIMKNVIWNIYFRISCYSFLSSCIQLHLDGGRCVFIEDGRNIWMVITGAAFISWYIRRAYFSVILRSIKNT